MVTLRTASSRASAANVAYQVPAVKGSASLLRNSGDAGSWGCVATYRSNERHDHRPRLEAIMNGSSVPSEVQGLFLVKVRLDFLYFNLGRFYVRIAPAAWAEAAQNNGTGLLLAHPE